MQSENTPKIDHSPMPEVDELEPHYPFVCSVCGHEQNARPSIFMRMGINSGHGSCMSCGTFLHLEIAPDNTHIISKPHDEWLRSFGIEPMKAGDE